MANLKKSFNFRHGVQVDDDNFIVDTLGRVGIGSTVPTEFLDVGGNIKIRGTVFADEVNTKSLVNTGSDGSAAFKLVNVGVTSMVSGVITAINSGIVTYYGDARYLQGMPTSQWVDTDVGLGYTSIYAAGNVGIATTDPRFSLQIGDTDSSDGTLISGVGIDSGGHIDLTGTITTNQINATGVTTASKFSGIGSDLTGLTADNIAYGTIPSERIGNIDITGIITAASFHGAFVGIATTARDLTSDAVISIESVTSNRSDLGLSTATTLHATTSIGIGTPDVNADFHLRKDGVAEAQITSNDDRARLVIGRDTTAFANNFIIDTDNDDIGAYPEESGLNSVDIYNYAPGNLNFFIRPDAEINKKFNWINHSTSDTMMSLTQDGNLGIGKTNPDHELHVVGTSTVSSSAYIGGNLEVSGVTTFHSSFIGTSVVLSGLFRTTNKIGVGFTDGDNDPSEDVQIGSSSTTITLSSTGNGKFTGILTAGHFSGIGSNITLISPENISSGSIDVTLNIKTGTGIITAHSFVGNGSGLTNLDGSQITSGTLTGININSGTGIITAHSFVGVGSLITEISASAITSGTIGNVDVNTNGIITATKFVGVGSLITELNPSEISDGGIDGNININAGTGIITATKFVGSGSSLTNLNPSNVQSGVFPNSLVSKEVVGLGVSADHTGNVPVGNQMLLIYDGTNNYFQGSVGYADTVVTSVAGVSSELVKFDLTAPEDLPNYKNEFRSLDVQILVINGNKHQSSKVLIVHDSFGEVGIETYSEVIINNSNNRIVKYNATYFSDIDDRILYINAVPEPGISGVTTYKVTMTTLT